MKRTLVAATALSLVITLASCGDNDEDPAPSSSPSPDVSSTTPSAPATATREPDGPPADWEREFTPTELAAGKAALARWTQWRQLSSQIYKQGRFTPGAEATLKEYDFWWQRNIRTLSETYDKGGLRRVSDVEPLWAYVKSVRLAANGETGEVRIVECTDYEPLRYERNGQPQEIKKPKHLVTPLLITMTKPDAEHDWMYYETKLKDKTSCAAQQ